MAKDFEVSGSAARVSPAVEQPSRKPLLSSKKKLLRTKYGSRIIKLVVGLGAVAVVLGVGIGLIAHFAKKDDDTGSGTWTLWSSWSACDVTCGGGLQIRTRTCQKTSASNGDCAGESSMQQQCGLVLCSGAFWASWEQWGSCDVTCGQGIQIRYRQCSRSNDSSAQCVGNSRELSICDMTNCPVYGTWSTWSTWGSCDVTCGGGNQTRMRTCNKASASDIDCVGQSSMQQPCSTWDCPNCSKTCDTGVLNSDCDTCLCNGTNITVRALTTSGKPLMDVTAYAASAPTTALATSDGSGSLVLVDFCIGAEVILMKEGFLDTNTILLATSVNASMQEIELPFLATSPVSRYRLAGEGAKFCCVATATPAVTYYEWFKNGVFLDNSLYPNQTELSLYNLTVSDSGQYRCRANSPAGAKYSNEATLTVKETPDEFCLNALEDKVVSLPSDCVQNETNTASYNVGTCSALPCRNETSDSEASCSDTSYSCCSPAEHLMVTVQCNGYNLSVAVVKSCACASCSLLPITISGVASGLTSDEPLNSGQVYMNGEFVTSTSSAGAFSIIVPSSPDAQSLTLKFKDLNNNFHDMIKVINIPAASSDDIYLSIIMVEKPEPVVIQSNVENTLFGGGDNATNSTSAVAGIVIPADSFYFDNGTKYSGSVSSVFTYILPSDADAFENIPGQFQFVDSDGEISQLETMGVFSLQFYDDSNRELSVSEPIEVTMAGDSDSVDPDTGESMQLWGLSESSGTWELLPFTQAKRRRRRNGHVVIGQMNTGSYYWRNCDIYWGARKCYFNTQVYRDTSFTGVIDKTNLKLTYLYTRQTWWGRTSARWTINTFTGPGCTEIFCSYASSYLQLETVSTDGNTVLIPKANDTGSTYSFTNTGSAVSIVMQPDGANFFTSKRECLLATEDSLKLSFHFPSTEEEIFTFNMFQPDIPDEIDDMDDYVEFETKSWCRQNGEIGVDMHQTKACAVKVRVTSVSNDLSVQEIKVVVTSGMGTAMANFTGDVIGVRGVYADSNGFACVSYRCPATIDGTFDGTQVSVSPMVARSNVLCTVYSPNTNLNGTTQIGRETFDFEITENVHLTSGLYQVNHNSFSDKQRDCIDIAERARDTCHRGLEVAVTFRCT